VKILLGENKIILYYYIIMVKELNMETSCKLHKPSTTNIKGSHSALNNAIRRRVGVRNNGSSYGPIYGLKGQTVGNCKNINNSNSGDSSDTIKWNRIYGGMKLFNTSECKVGCKGTPLKN
jgi:hypothetical protein